MPYILAGILCTFHKCNMGIRRFAFVASVRKHRVMLSHRARMYSLQRTLNAQVLRRRACLGLWVQSSCGSVCIWDHVLRSRRCTKHHTRCGNSPHRVYLRTFHLVLVVSVHDIHNKGPSTLVCFLNELAHFLLFGIHLDEGF